MDQLDHVMVIEIRACKAIQNSIFRIKCGNTPFRTFPHKKFAEN